jgi:hypothetical protein
MEQRLAEPISYEATSCYATLPGRVELGSASHAGVTLIDDLEDDVTLGLWMSPNDGSGFQFPRPCAISSLLQGERGPGNTKAMRTYGRMPPGQHWAKVGRLLRSSPPQCDHPFDASGFMGVRFWAKGPGTIRVVIGSVATTERQSGGSCDQNCFDGHQKPVTLSDVWASYEIPFASLTQEGWGTRVDFEPSQLLDINWGAIDPLTGLMAECFDFWIDDVAFYR